MKDLVNGRGSRIDSARNRLIDAPRQTFHVRPKSDSKSRSYVFGFNPFETHSNWRILSDRAIKHGNPKPYEEHVPESCSVGLKDDVLHLWHTGDCLRSRRIEPRNLRCCVSMASTSSIADATMYEANSFLDHT